MKWVICCLILFFGDRVYSKVLCTNYFESNTVRIENARQTNIRSAQELKTVTDSLRPVQLLNQGQSRLASYILEKLKEASTEALRQTENARTIEEINTAGVFAHRVGESLRAAMEYKTAEQMRIVENFEGYLRKRDQREELKLAEEILGHKVDPVIYTQLSNLAVHFNKSFKRVLEKWIQVRYQIKLIYSEIDDPIMMYFLTNFALQTNRPTHVAEAYSRSRARVRILYPRVSESMHYTLLFKYMEHYIPFNVEKAHTDYFKIKELMRTHNQLLLSVDR